MRQRLLDEGRGRVLGFADAQADRRVGIRGQPGKQLAQLFERVGMQFVEVWIHGSTRVGERETAHHYRRHCAPSRQAPGLTPAHSLKAWVNALCSW